MEIWLECCVRWTCWGMSGMAGPKSNLISFLHSKPTSPVWTLSLRRRGAAAESIPASFPTIKSSDPSRQLQSVSNRFPFDFCFCLCITKKLSEDVVFGQGLGRYAFRFSVLFLRACVRVSSVARRGRLILWRWSCRQLLITLSAENQTRVCWKNSKHSSPLSQLPAPLFSASFLLPFRLSFTLENEAVCCLLFPPSWHHSRFLWHYRSICPEASHGEDRIEKAWR